MGSGGVDSAWAAAWVGECAVFARAVVFDLVASDELLTDGDLELIPDDGDLDLAATELVPGPIAGTGEGDVARRIDLAGHRHHRCCRALLGLSATHGTSHPGGLLGRVMTAGVRRNEHASMVSLSSCLCKRAWSWGLDVWVDAVGVDEGELLECLFPVRGDLAFNEPAGCFAFLAW